MNIENIDICSGNVKQKRIKQLSVSISNQIAAGEVIDRPSSALKELIENSIDAGASKIVIMYANGGKSFLSVKDNGYGIFKEDLALALERHATSKIRTIDDLINVGSLGFRGEALPSIGAISELKIKSKSANQKEAFEVSCIHGEVKKIRPTQYLEGTLVEIKNLFLSIPARLKFLKTDRAEGIAILDVVKRMSLSNPKVSFKLLEDRSEGFSREIFKVEGSVEEDSLKVRIGSTLKNTFIDNAHYLFYKNQEIEIKGFVSSPTFPSRNTNSCYFFVNGRYVRDRNLLRFVRSAYGDALVRGSFPAVVLFLEVSKGDIDVNVHPSKMQVRFKKPDFISYELKKSIRSCLFSNRFQLRNHITKKAVSFLQKNVAQPTNFMNEQETVIAPSLNLNLNAEDYRIKNTINNQDHAKTSKREEQNFLGTPKAHFFKNFIVAQNEHELVIVDQHAAHERIIYEKLKKQKCDLAIVVQELLVPEIFELTSLEVEAIIEKQDLLKSIGLDIERFGPSSICLRGIPALLGKADVRGLFFDILEDLDNLSKCASLDEKINKLLSSMACHRSVRSGRVLKYEEMDVLLREMEKTPNSDQCNHGRPTYLKLDLKQLNRLFGRS